MWYPICIIFCQKLAKFTSCFFFSNKLLEIKLLATCTPLICVQLICYKKTTFYLEKCRRSYSHTSNKGIPLAAARPPISHFNHFNNRKACENILHETDQTYALWLGYIKRWHTILQKNPQEWLVSSMQLLRSSADHTFWSNPCFHRLAAMEFRLISLYVSK